MKDENQFQYIFWFIVGVVAFGAGLSVYAMYLDKTRIDIVLTFWLSTAVAGCIGYLIGSSAKPPKKTGESGTTTATFEASVTTEPKEETP